MRKMYVLLFLVMCSFIVSRIFFGWWWMYLMIGKCVCVLCLLVCLKLWFFGRWWWI